MTDQASTDRSETATAYPMPRQPADWTDADRAPGEDRPTDEPADEPADEPVDETADETAVAPGAVEPMDETTAEPTDTEPTGAEPTGAEPTDAAAPADMEPAAIEPVDEARLDEAVAEPVDEAPVDEAREAHLLPGQAGGVTTGALWDTQAARDLRDRSREVQLHFIDDPQGSAAQARELAHDAVDRLHIALTERVRELDSRSATGGEAGGAAPDGEDTEVLRAAVRGYRDLIERVLSW